MVRVLTLFGSTVRRQPMTSMFAIAAMFNTDVIHRRNRRPRARTSMGPIIT